MCVEAPRGTLLSPLLWTPMTPLEKYSDESVITGSVVDRTSCKGKGTVSLPFVSDGEFSFICSTHKY